MATVPSRPGFQRPIIWKKPISIELMNWNWWLVVFFFSKLRLAVSIWQWPAWLFLSPYQFHLFFEFSRDRKKNRNVCCTASVLNYSSPFLFLAIVFIFRCKLQLTPKNQKDETHAFFLNGSNNLQWNASSYIQLCVPLAFCFFLVRNTRIDDVRDYASPMSRRGVVGMKVNRGRRVRMQTTCAVIWRVSRLFLNEFNGEFGFSRVRKGRHVKIQILFHQRREFWLEQTRIKGKTKQKRVGLYSFHRVTIEKLTAMNTSPGITWRPFLWFFTSE